MTEGHAPAEAKSLPSPECPAVSLVPLASGSLGQAVQRQLNLSIMQDLGSNLSDPGGPVPVQGHLGQFALSGHSHLTGHSGPASSSPVGGGHHSAATPPHLAPATTPTGFLPPALPASHFYSLFSEQQPSLLRSF